MSFERRLWERLLQSLNGWCTATGAAPGLIVVTFKNPGHPARVAEIVMTRREWDQMASVAWGDPDRAAQYVKGMVLGLQPHERFLVYESYDLVPSATAELPVDPDEELLSKLAHQHPDGGWHARDRDGNVVDEFPGRRD